MFIKENQDNMSPNLKRNGFIDFLKFIFAIIILIHHSWQFFPILPIGYIGVEFFFLVTGWFMAKKFYNFEPNENIFVITRNYIIRKVKIFYLEYIVAIFLGLLVILIFVHSHIPSISDILSLTIGDVLLLQIWGFPARSVTGVMWYLCAMIGDIAILLPIILKNNKAFVNIIAPLIVLISLGSISYKYGNMCVIMEPIFDGFIRIGLIRAIADISLGYCLYYVTIKINSINFSKTGLVLIALFEFILYIIIFYLIIIVRRPGNVDFIIVLLLSISLSISFSQKSLLANFFQKDFFNRLGFLSLNIFLNHFYVGWIIMILDLDNLIGPYLSIIFYFLGSAICITLNYLIARDLKKIEYKKLLSILFIKRG